MAIVKIDFKIAGADVVDKMTRSISSSLERTVREQSRIRTKAEADINKAVLRAHLDRQKMAYKADLDAARETQRAKVQMARDSAREQAKIQATAARDAARVVAKANREASAAAARENRDVGGAKTAFQGVGGAVLKGAGVGLVKGVAAVGRGAMTAARALSDGVGVDLSLQHGIRQRTEQERLAVDLSNAGYISGDKVNGKRRDKAEIMGLAQTVGMQTAQDPTQVIEAMASMTSISGDLDSSMRAIGDLAKLSKATGSDLGDMASAAGNVAAQLGDIADAGERARIVESVMRTVAGQGKLGAVEIKDMAAQMAKLASRASEFSGGNMESTMGSLGALAQEARARGGAATASQAATSVGTFINQFSKGARRKEMAAAMGGDMSKVEDKQGRLLDPEELMVNMLHATKGDKNKMGKLIADAGAQRVSRGFQSIYNAAGGGKAGEAAVRAEFARLKKASMGKGEVEESFNASMGTTSSKAQQFQQKLDALVVGLADKVLPSLVRLAPAAEKVAAGLASLADWAARNPFSGLGAVISGFMLKEMASAGIGQILRNGLGGGAGAAGAGGAGAVGTLGAAVGGGVIGGAIGTLAAGGANTVLDWQQADANAKQSSALNAISGLSRGTDADKANAQAVLDRLTSDRENQSGVLGKFVSGATAGVRGLASGDLTAANLASAIPVAAVGRGIYESAVGTQQQNQANANLDPLIAELGAKLDKPTKIDGVPTFALQGMGDLIGALKSAGRDPASAPISGT